MDVVDATLAGYMELRGGYQVGVDGVPWGLNERVRPSLTIEPDDRSSVVVVPELSFIQGRNSTEELVDVLKDSAAGEILESACTYTPDTPYDQVSDYLSVERLYFKYNHPLVDLTIGRQAINWGSGMAFHPTDVYAELLVAEPWKERSGVNSIKANVPFGNHSVTGLVALGDDLSEFGEDEPDAEKIPLSGALKATFNVVQTDVSAVGYYRTDGDWFAGGDLRGNLEVGWWVEGGWHGEEEAPEVVAGLDYSFAVLQVLYVAAEYRYDGSGSAPDDYDWESRSAAGSMPYDCAFLPAAPKPRATLGRHYVDATVRLSATEDLSIGATTLLNAEDGTGLLIPNVGYNIGQHVAVQASAQIPYGKDGEFKPPSSQLKKEIAGETIDFSGQIPDATLSAWVRYSF